jgi:hypothetical protein
LAFSMRAGFVIDDVHLAMLVGLFQQTALDQPACPTAPGRIGAGAQVGLLDVDERSGFDVANFVGHRVVRAADARDDSDHGLVRIKASRDLGFAPPALAQFACFRRFVIRGADVDQFVAARFRDQPKRLFRRKPQLLAVDVVGGNIRRGGAEIFQFKRKDRQFDVPLEGEIAPISPDPPLARNGLFPWIDRVKCPILVCGAFFSTEFASKCEGERNRACCRPLISWRAARAPSI